MNIVIPTVFTCYSTGLSALVKIKNIDQRIFGFVTPFWKHAVLFGAIAGVVHQGIEFMNQKITKTYYERKKLRLLCYSEHFVIYKAIRVINPVIAGIASQKAIEMVFHINIPLKFVGLFAVPLTVIVFTNLFKKERQIMYKRLLKLKK